MIWHPRSSSKFAVTYPSTLEQPREAFANGDEPIAARCGDYLVMADGQGLIAVPYSTRNFAWTTVWAKPCTLASAVAAREVIGRAPLTRAWFETRGWLRSGGRK